MSPRSFRRRFENEVGITVTRYIARARATKAQSLLETTSLSMVAIARHCGFRSADTLRYAFVKEFDVTPSDYRHRFGAGAGSDRA